jgi:hypothetical protein
VFKNGSISLEEYEDMYGNIFKTLDDRVSEFRFIVSTHSFFSFCKPTVHIVQRLRMCGGLAPLLDTSAFDGAYLSTRHSFTLFSCR